jgi:hypothetical protein
MCLVLWVEDNRFGNPTGGRWGTEERLARAHSVFHRGGMSTQASRNDRACDKSRISAEGRKGVIRGDWEHGKFVFYP